MAKYSQAKRPLKVDTDLGEDVLLLEAFGGEEGMSTPFSFTLDMLSEDPSIDPDSLLRSPVTLTIELHSGMSG